MNPALSPALCALIDALAADEAKAYLRDPAGYEQAIERGEEPCVEKDRRTCLYRHFDAAGQLLYVGVSYSPSERKNWHRASSPWFCEIARTTLTWFPGRRAALDAELQAIKNENPIHNRQGKPGGNQL